MPLPNSVLMADPAQPISGGATIIPSGSNITVPASQLADINRYPDYSVVTVTIASATGMGAVPTRVVVFNDSPADLDNTVDDNGSGAASITYTYSDNFGGRLISRILSASRAGMGAVFYKLQMRCVDDSNVGNPAALGLAAPYWLQYTQYGNIGSIQEYNMSEDQNRPDNDTSIEVVTGKFNVTSFSQFSTVVSVGTTTLTFYFHTK